MTILLNEVLNISKPQEHKLHLACRNENFVHPLNEYVANPSNWLAWNEWRGGKNDWTRPYILSLMEFYPRRNGWLFGGVFEVVERRDDGYKLRSLPAYEKYVGRLIATFHRYQGMRGRAYTQGFFIHFQTTVVTASCR